MPSEEYESVTLGALKLKGVNSSSKIHKHKKKRPKPTTDSTTVARENESTEKGEDESPDRESDDKSRQISKEVDEEVQSTDHLNDLRAGKTDAELRHEERRRKRLDERLKREGTKTHKERVEELNRYLSNLSEHHDMYVFLLPFVLLAVIFVFGWNSR